MGSGPGTSSEGRLGTRVVDSATGTAAATTAAAATTTATATGPERGGLAGGCIRVTAYSENSGVIRVTTCVRGIRVMRVMRVNNRGELS